MIACHLLPEMFLFVYKHAAIRVRAACLRILPKSGLFYILYMEFRVEMCDVHGEVVQAVQVILS